jgi:hypothetical protein
MPKLIPSSIVAVSPSQVSCTLDQEAVILNLASGNYYGLNPVGRAVWQLLQQPRPVKEIQQAIISEYDVEPGRGESDVLSLLEHMLSAGLVELHDQPRT